MRKRLPYYLIAAVLAAADQIIKALTRAYIPLGGHVVVIPHMFGLTYIRNTGAAFASFSGGTAVLTLVSLAAAAVIVIAIWRSWLSHPAGKWILAVLLAGTVGNFIDRAFVGFVTDMIETLFMNFAIFNFADICVTLGAIALVVYVLIFYDKLEKQKGEAHAGDADGD